MNARMLPVRRSASIALRFEGRPRRGVCQYFDGNGHGIRSAEIAAGIDTLLAPRQFLIYTNSSGRSIRLTRQGARHRGARSPPTAVGSASATKLAS